MKYDIQIPATITQVAHLLEHDGYEAYLVGGCVRDLLLDRKPTDWDITTNATPEQIQEVFPHTFYENEYGTVGVVDETATDETLKVVEITPYRTEATYSNKRHPDQVSFSDNIEDDLQRRDFSMNAIAYNISKGHLYDPYNGQKDIDRGLIRAVGNPNTRFDEDALRILRAIRFSAQLNFAIEDDTEEAIRKHAAALKHISVERIRDELSKLIATDHPMQGLERARELGVLTHTIPELEEGYGIEQNKDHVYDVWTHLLKSLQNAADKGWEFDVRLAALFHDIGKPRTRRYDKKSNDYTFYGHEVVGARMTEKVLKRLAFSKDTVDRVTKLVRWHMFFSDIDSITHSAVRRLVRNVGVEDIWKLMRVRRCDRIGMGRPKESPYRLRKYEAMIEEVIRDPISVGQLKVDGKTIMDVSGETPGPRIGWILHALLEEVLDDPSKNTEEYLTERIQKLSELSDTELRVRGEAGKEKREQKEEDQLADIRKKHHVR